MKFNVFLTQQPTMRWQAFIPYWPNCLVEAESRAEAIRNIEQLALTLINQSEVIELDLPLPAMLNDPNFDIEAWNQEWARVKGSVKISF